jgi:NOL1/NOP2/fmu family ribosome biogenesis protein
MQEVIDEFPQNNHFPTKRAESRFAPASPRKDSKMKQTLKLFLLAIIVSLLFSAAGLPVIPVQAAGSKAVMANHTQNKYTLTVTSEHGTVSKNPDKLTYCYGEVVQLTATPAIGWSFANWTGNATGTNNPVSIRMNGNKAVTANYSQNEYTLTITSEHGTVSRNPDQATYHYGDAVELTVAPAAGWSFVNWTGDVTGMNNPVSITVDGDKTVTANYAQAEYTLAITSEHGNVIKNPDQATYHYGDVVELTAVSATGWSFANWTGDATGANNPGSVTINGNTAVTANYSRVEYTLTIGSAYGAVTKTPDRAAYSDGEVVELKATDNHDWLFVNWTGDVTGGTNPISITMNSNKTVTATFIRRGPDTVGVFRPLNNTMYLKNKNETGFGDFAIGYGLPGDYPVVGDWDGNGTTTIGVYRNGYFYLRNDNSPGFANLVFAFGMPGDQPIAGDWNGDGVDTIGVFRPSSGQFFLRNSNSEGTADASFYLGNAGDVGIAGDWDGDGLDTTGVFRPSDGMIFLKNKNENGSADAALNYGLPGDRPVVGDWDDDGVDTIGIYRNNTFYLCVSNSGGFADLVFILGKPGDLPLAGNWDGLP